MAGDQVQQLNVLRLCTRAALRPSVIGRVWPEEMRRALSGICHLYGLHAIDSHLDTYEMELHGFASERFPREAIVHQIGFCIGGGRRPVQERVLDSLTVVLRSEFERLRTQHARLQGFGVFHARELQSDRYLLQFEDPLANYFSIGENYLSASV